MHPLLRYTLDLFEALPAPTVQPTPDRGPLIPKNNKPFMPPARVNTAQGAPESIALKATEPAALPEQSLLQALTAAAFTHPQANRQLRLEEAEVAYRFERAKRRTIGFAIGPDGLVVRAPRWTPMGEVEAALRSKAPWIVRKLDETRERQRRQDAAHIAWCDGASLPFLGEQVTVVLDPSHAFAAIGAQLDGHGPGATAADPPASGVRCLRVGLPKTASPAQIRDAVQAWLMRQAQVHFTARLDHFAPLLQVQWSRLGLSNAHTRWGSARADGSIRLNWRLIHFRPAVIDYVVAHELSHLRVMDHSPRFWDVVRSVVPDYSALRGQLKDDAAPRWK